MIGTIIFWYVIVGIIMTTTDKIFRYFKYRKYRHASETQRKLNFLAERKGKSIIYKINTLAFILYVLSWPMMVYHYTLSPNRGTSKKL